MSEIAQTDNFNDKTNIKVVGVGGAGGNAVNRMIAEGLQSVEFIAINTDAKDLMRSDADVKISLNDATSRGLGAGADPEKGAKAAQDHQSDIEESLKGADMVFVTCGEGGGTGTGASPIVARAAHQQGALTIAVVTRPFSFEGPQRAASAALGIENLRKEVDALIVIPNDRLLELSDRTIGIVDAFKTADTALLAGVQGITDLISSNSYIHVDFNDVNAILRGAGTALFGIGSARGEDRAPQALMPTPRRRLRLKPRSRQSLRKARCRCRRCPQPRGQRRFRSSPSLSLFRLRKPRRCSRCPLIFRPLRNPSFRHSTRPPSMKWCLRTTPAIWIFRISCAKSNAKTRKDRSWQVL